MNNSITGEVEGKLKTKSYLTSKDEIVVSNNISTSSMKVNSKINIGKEDASTALTSIEDAETGEKADYTFNIEITGINGDDFTAIFTDVDTGERYDINTAEVQASWYPLIVIAIHVARHGVKHAIKKYLGSINYFV